jgi:hypothetical protein
MSSQLCPGQSLIDRKIDAENFELLTSKLKGQVDQITCPFVVKRQGTGNREKIFIYYPYLPIPFLLSPVTCHLSPTLSKNLSSSSYTGTRGKIVIANFCQHNF